MDARNISNIKNLSVFDYCNKTGIHFDPKSKKFYYPSRKNANKIFSIDQDKNLFFDFKNGKGGKGLIDFYIYISGCDFNRAIVTLANNNDNVVSMSVGYTGKYVRVKEPKKFILPAVENQTNQIMLGKNYLVSRGFPPTYVDALFQSEIIYCSVNKVKLKDGNTIKNNILVFPGKKLAETINIDNGVMKGSKYLVAGSDKKSDGGFGLSYEVRDKAILFESAIDLLSFVLLGLNRNNERLISTAGMPSKDLFLNLKKNGISNISSAFDNDPAGKNVTTKYRDLISEVYTPIGDDWNCDLVTNRRKNNRKKNRSM